MNQHVNRYNTLSATTVSDGAVETDADLEATQTEMSDADFAAIDFEAWQHATGEFVPPSNVMWCKQVNPTLISIRIAWCILYKSKAELISIFECDPDLAMEMTDLIIEAKQWIEPLHRILECGSARMLCAGSVAAQVEA
jgi:hypothetical protein